MYLVLIGWIYVALMMAAAEAGAPDGTLLGALVTFLGYGVAPAALVGYLLDAPRRRRAIRAREAADEGRQARGQAGSQAAADDAQQRASAEPDADREAAARAEPPAVAPVRKEP